MSDAENTRHYAAGFLGAATILASAGHASATILLLREVQKYMDDPRVDSPPQLRDCLAGCIADPVARISDIAALERMFVHPANTALEDAGIRLGKG